MKCLCGRRITKKTQQQLENEIIHERILPHQIKMLHFIFNDIACRSPQPTLSYHNFIIFLSLTGLWGDKLFQYFSMNKNSKINQRQFLYGMARTIKAPVDQKIKVLFNFFTDQNEQGIKYPQFLKMLYHFSKKELKELLISDGVFVQEEIIPCTTTLKEKQGSVIHLKLQTEPTLNSKSAFEQAYENIIGNSVDPGTILKLKTQNLTYQINYCNMLNLTKQFASHAYGKFGIEETGKMNYDQFKQWIKGHHILFDNFFAAFHEEVWGQTNGKPNFLTHIDRECEVQLQENGHKQLVWLMLVGSALVFSQSYKQRQKVIKIIWLYELNIMRLDRENVHGLTMKHLSDSYFHPILIFKEEKALEIWLDELKIFQKNYLHAKYEIDHIIGTGRFSTVYKCRDRKDQKVYALKVLTLQKLQQKQQLAIQNQSQILKVLKFPAIIKYFETIYSRRHIYVVTEYIPGLDLFQYVKKNQRLTEYQAALILGQIIQAVQHLHSLDIIHRDLKPQNIMIQTIEVESDNFDVEKIKVDKIKIIDFGFANFISALNEKFERVGTLNYIAPQILLGEKPSFHNDVFSIGSILYFMLRGKYAFDSPELGGSALKTVQGDYNLFDSVWADISDEAKDLVQMLLTVDPNKRITLSQAINHQWFSSLKHHQTQLFND